jgi:catechol 2,3-dioxygenase-like lactoylglutathione lyase family enzyme
MTWRLEERHESASGCVCDDPWVDQRISLVTLGVTDLARARSFYEALGWHDAQQPDDEVCFFQAGGMVFGLWTALGGHGVPGIELAHNVRSPEEVGALLAEAERGSRRPVSARGPEFEGSGRQCIGTAPVLRAGARDQDLRGRPAWRRTGMSRQLGYPIRSLVIGSD